MRNRGLISNHKLSSLLTGRSITSASNLPKEYRYLIHRKAKEYRYLIHQKPQRNGDQDGFWLFEPSETGCERRIWPART